MRGIEYEYIEALETTIRLHKGGACSQIEERNNTMAPRRWVVMDGWGDVSIKDLSVTGEEQLTYA
jgi:hypothetical protein